jgi:hypothetical protein
MKTRSILSLRALVLGGGAAAALAASGCCMGGGSSAPIAPIAPVPAVAAPAPFAAGTQMLTLSAGFLPDPTTAATVAGGGISASTLATPDVYCAGNVGVLPNMTLTTTTPIAGLRVLVRSTADTTLVVRLSDGRVLCNDDGGGYPNPAVMADFPAGTHQIYVGSFHTGETPAATIGLTTNPMLANEALP